MVSLRLAADHCLRICEVQGERCGEVTKRQEVLDAEERLAERANK